MVIWWWILEAQKVGNFLGTPCTSLCFLFQTLLHRGSSSISFNNFSSMSCALQMNWIYHLDFVHFLQEEIDFEYPGNSIFPCGINFFKLENRPDTTDSFVWLVMNFFLSGNCLLHPIHREILSSDRIIAKLLWSFTKNLMERYCY